MIRRTEHDAVHQQRRIARTNRPRLIAAMAAIAALLFAVAACSSSKNSSGSGAGSTGNASGLGPTLEKFKKAGVVDVAYANEKPYDYDANGRVTGLDPELLRAFFGQYGIRLKFTLVDFAGLIPGLQAGRYDVIGADMFILPARCQIATFGNPDYQMTDALAVAKGNALNIHTFKDIATSGAQFGTSAGGEEVQYAKWAGISNSKITQYPSYADAVAALAAGHVDVVAQPAVSLRATLAALNSDKVEYIDLTTPPRDNKGVPQIGYGGPAFNKSTPDLVDAYNKWLATARNNGTYAQIAQKFGFTKSEFPPATTTAASLCSGS